MGDILKFPTASTELRLIENHDDTELILNRIHKVLGDISKPNNEWLIIFIISGLIDYFDNIDTLRAHLASRDLQHVLRTLEDIHEVYLDCDDEPILDEPS